MWPNKGKKNNFNSETWSPFADTDFVKVKLQIFKIYRKKFF